MDTIIKTCALVAAAFLFACIKTPGPSLPPEQSKAICGDGKARGKEVCDREDLRNKTCHSLEFGEGQLLCQANCQDYDRSSCGAPTTCNNGTKEGVEICDTADLGGATCESLGYGPGDLSCYANCAGFDVSQCGAPPGCGDDNRDGVEVCDGEDFGGLSCRTLNLGQGDLRCGPKCDSIDTSDCSPDCPADKDCAGRQCGDDPICGESCGTCNSGTCNSAGQCSGANCPADKDCGSRVCGPDPVCGESCGTCNSGTCNSAGQCSPNCPNDMDCSNRQCGLDPVCGLSCGQCSNGWDCVNGTCIEPDTFGCDQPITVACGDTSTGNNAGNADGINYYSSCSIASGHSGGEVVYRFTATTQETVTFRISGLQDDLDLLVLGQGCNIGVCHGKSAQFDEAPEEVEVSVNAGDVLDFVVDGWGETSSSFTYQVSCTQACVPSCGSRQCGLDPVCGESCGVCTSGSCNNNGLCGSCEEDCSGRVCGPDPVCGNSCGTCDSGVCNVQGQCISCTPDCSNRECGADLACGVSCGSCTGTDVCYQGQCLAANGLCSNYSATTRLNDCATASCGDPLTCATFSDFFETDQRCVDVRPCAASPAARCCGSDEFCGKGSGVEGPTFCCKPGELFDFGYNEATCVDADIAIGCSTDGDCPSAWGRGHCDLNRQPAICVECYADNHCTDPDKPACDTRTATCVPCTSDAYCTGTSTPACDLTEQTCVDCTSATHCSGATPHCAGGNYCVACLDHPDCGGSTPYCRYNDCVQCTSNDHCSGSTPYCNSSQCQACPSGYNDPECQDMASGRRGCYDTRYQSTDDSCNADVDCSNGSICDAPVGLGKECIVICQ